MDYVLVLTVTGALVCVALSLYLYFQFWRWKFGYIERGFLLLFGFLVARNIVPHIHSVLQESFYGAAASLVGALGLQIVASLLKRQVSEILLAMAPFAAVTLGISPDRLTIGIVIGSFFLLVLVLCLAPSIAVAAVQFILSLLYTVSWIYMSSHAVRLIQGQQQTEDLADLNHDAGLTLSCYSDTSCACRASVSVVLAFIRAVLVLRFYWRAQKAERQGYQRVQEDPEEKHAEAPAPKAQPVVVQIEMKPLAPEGKTDTPSKQPESKSAGNVSLQQKPSE